MMRKQLVQLPLNMPLMPSSLAIYLRPCTIWHTHVRCWEDWRYSFVLIHQTIIQGVRGYQQAEARSPAKRLYIACPSPAPA